MDTSTPVIAHGRAGLGAFTLRPMDRTGLLAPRLADAGLPRRDAAGRRRALVLRGEGGIGKSVLLGQYLERLEAGRRHAVVFVPCPPAGGDLGTFEAADRTLGMATGDLRAAGDGLLDLLGRVRAQGGGEVVLLVDSLDLRLDERTLKPITRVLARALEIGHVVIGCRAPEYTGLLADGAHWLAGRMEPLDLPPLSAPEIIAWAEAYLDRTDEHPADRDAFLASLRDGMAGRRSLQEVCSLPVRLALTCRTFAGLGHVPPELTVHGLFNDYWQTRIRAHGGLAGTPEGRAKETTALKLLAHVVRPDGTVAPHVPDACLDDTDAEGRDLLLSEGVVRDRGTALEFFHQTFAEYGHARWLLRRGVDAPETVRFGERVAAGATPLWEIAGSLLLQAGYRDYLRLAERLPADRPPAARVRAYAALHRPEPEALAVFADEVAGRPGLLPPVLNVLGDAPSARVPHAFATALSLLAAHPESVAVPAVRALAALLPRHPAAEAPDALRSALETVLGAAGALPAATWETLPEQLIVALDGHPARPATLALLRETYARLGRRGQQAALRAHLALDAHLTGADVADLAARALAEPRPHLSKAETVALTGLFWHEPAVRAARDWTSPVAMADEEPPPGWQDGQVEYLRRLAGQDLGVRAQMLDALVERAARTGMDHIEVVRRFTETDPSWTAERLAASTAPRTALAQVIIPLATALAPGLTPAQRASFLDCLTLRRAVEPRRVFPAQIALAGDDVAWQRRILAALARPERSAATVGGAVDAWLDQVPAGVLRALTPGLRTLLEAEDTATRRRRARLEGWAAPTDPAARAWLAGRLLDGPDPKVASAAVTTLTRAFTTTPPSPEAAAWLAGLLASRNPDAAAGVALLLAAPEAPVPEPLVPATVTRLRTAIDHGEPARLTEALARLFAKAARSTRVPARTVEEVHALLRISGSSHPA
ncbi:NACHT domain-containing protein [Actinomadura macrotermitis]|uniref:NACHT domain-containing protein n=1 Tax=Actinomadura macrotermitis TaxID=2585200 RepID=A0A7K0C178_9ACTN|nr:hypothetical protein [Actinomadura macrotermitis]MQY06544.1 hypothetical protein [Actinomadura macrotermitis]